MRHLQLFFLTLLSGTLWAGTPQPARQKALRINEGLAALAMEARVDFLDIGPKFPDAQGNIPTALMSDAVHPTLSGYQISGDALTSLLP